MLTGGYTSGLFPYEAILQTSTADMEDAETQLLKGFYRIAGLLLGDLWKEVMEFNQNLPDVRRFAPRNIFNDFILSTFNVHFENVDVIVPKHFHDGRKSVHLDANAPGPSCGTVKNSMRHMIYILWRGKRDLPISSSNTIRREGKFIGPCLVVDPVDRFGGRIKGIYTASVFIDNGAVK